MNTNYKNNSSTLKNIIIGICIIIGIIFIILYIYSWHQVKIEEQYLTSYLISTNTISQQMSEIKEIKDALTETPTSYFVYISYTKNEDIYNFEKKLKPLIDQKSLQNNFYFIDITDIKEKNKNYKKNIAKELDITEDNLKKIPVILYFENSTLKTKITTIKEFEKLINDESINSF